MEKKRAAVSRDDSPGVCERLLKAIRVCSPNFRAISRRVSFSPTALTPPNPKPVAKVTPVKMKTVKKMKIEAVAASETKTDDRKQGHHYHHHHHHHVEIPIHRSEDHHHIENRFTDYINRAKMKMRTGGSDGGGGKAEHTGKHHDDHHFTEFINRARMKLRTSSSMNDGVKGK